MQHFPPLAGPSASVPSTEPAKATPIPRRPVASPNLPAEHLSAGKQETSRAHTMPEELKQRFDACVCATSALVLCRTQLGWIVTQAHEAQAPVTRFPRQLWDEAQFRENLGALFDEQHAASSPGRLRAWGQRVHQRLFGAPMLEPPPQSEKLKDLVLQMGGYIEQGRHRELLEALRPILARTSAFSWVRFGELGAHECAHHLERAFEWLSQGDGGLTSLAYRLASANLHVGRYLKKLGGLAPGAPAEERRQAAEVLLGELSRKFEQEELWDLKKIERTVFLDPRNLGFLSFYMTTEIPSAEQAALAAKGLRIGGRHGYLSLDHGHLVSMTLVTLLQKDPRDTATHEVDHALTAMHRKPGIGTMTFESRILDEMRSQLGDSQKPFATIRKDIADYYIAAYGKGAVVELNAAEQAVNLNPSSPEAKPEIERFMDCVGELLQRGTPRADICGLLRRVETLPNFYAEVKGALVVP
jgi:hypothetical protein